MEIRGILESDFPAVIALNNANLPAVSKMDEDSLKNLHQQALFGWLMEEPRSHQLAGFCLILPPGISYASLNYQWVSEHYQTFQYLDRIVISQRFRGQGLGKRIYNRWFEEAGAIPMLLEVNIKPRNQGSIVFHEKLGFEPVGEQDTDGGEKRVQYMKKA